MSRLSSRRRGLRSSQMRRRSQALRLPREWRDRRHARRPARTDHHLSTVFLLQPERFFERVRVGLVHLEAGVLVANPRPGVVQARMPLAGGNLFDADGNFHHVTKKNAKAAKVAKTVGL